MTAKKKVAGSAHTPVPPPPSDPHPPTNAELIRGEAIEPRDRVRIWDASRFESYVHQWAYLLQSRGVYGKVVWAPGAGDKGRDVRAYVKDETGPWDNYQCKHYKDPLAPGDVWLELAKLCHYTRRGDFSKPRKYYFVSPHDLGPELSTLIGRSPEIRRRLLAEWEKVGGPISVKLVPLDPPMRAYVEKFDFGIVKCKQQEDILVDLKDTEYYRRVFGCPGLRRPPRDPIPAKPTPEETQYIKALRAAFADHLKIDAHEVTDKLLAQRQDLAGYLRTSRVSFYSAEQLYRFGRDTFPTSHCFEDLQAQVYIGVLGTAMDDHPDGFARVRAVTTEAGKLALGNHFLVALDMVEVQDRHGICHQIVNANDGKLVWVQKKKGGGNA